MVNRNGRIANPTTSSSAGKCQSGKASGALFPRRRRRPANEARRSAAPRGRWSHEKRYSAAARRLLEPWVNGLAFEREHADDPLVDAAERLVADEVLERLDAEPKL